MRAEQAKTKRTGFAVIVVLCTVIMLEVLLLGFNYRCRVNLRAAERLQKSQQALYCAIAGLNIAIAAIKDTNDIYTNRNLPNLLSAEDAFTIGEGQCSVTVAEENGKLNVNLLKDKYGKLDRTRIDQLLRLIDLINQEPGSQFHIGYSLVPCIIDWTDSDDQVTYLSFIKHENLGAESDYYSDLNPAYRCKNQPFEAIDELLLIKGITVEIFERIRDYVTVYGDGKVNLNCASKRVIESLSQKMDPALAQIIADRRKIKPFDSIMELRDVPGMTDSIYYAIEKTATVRPTDRYYYVTSRANVGQPSRTVAAILRANNDTKNVEVVLYKELQGAPKKSEKE